MRIDKETARDYLHIADEFMRLHGQASYEVDEVVRWAMSRSKLHLPRDRVIEIHKALLSQASRMDVTTDGLGRTVRLRHCATIPGQDDEGKPVQRSLWAHIDDVTDELLLTSLEQRRCSIRADALALKADLDFINARRQAVGKRPFQMTFDNLLDDDDLSATGA